MCEYPDGMGVDPYPLVWKKMREMALRMKSIADDVLQCERFFDRFASTMKTLEDISLCQASNDQLSEEQV
ncbi:hypothetical protein PC116_g3896 [Phytophthora cactorum]|nr:hypothetical protein C6341_g2734 [Phytophthora cactorum]KAG4248377.1 hypothetical protein PC116_g3896 [Phytophthora cactorum]